ncbi:hypothetical protein PSN45_000696 [Yamadazyma tenuis]|uniref:Uncharacterized protein n=1 Tax=Candida tenuis (strain ATCC 10573 / BCRC 21748 / CBS 615 / JCM 9827 / NBRC 10315 / NRRL Y-1498 / VKM Y-70) TaxID=590646 RepID=G3BA10_CANTC|nr:uncharacterized protein CANTEDRAFT_115441 [Yamadazyma tenuis ATCC 10573]XP_006688909.1 uncharacterized protein CANTEDRAFT_115441 [Yamadazyma tenuis ATCC 10573]EGV62738.1 hypothetical protein CANTEDRAFT_115441 [Yamadazyma tenuis ATCC 10573]EGV62739.1 hypothetical protein CANTEDRAFT_115441 [Yamadazyma tenuis ATCC 10573]WEJ93235.1 hypothetical protein PSN45_000696 [Yamadazyma tenuis]
MSSVSWPVLSSKDSNVSSPSPTKSSKSRSSSVSPFKASPTKRSKLSPTRFIPTTEASSSLQGKGLGFTIYEDKIHKTTSNFNDLEIDGKENINALIKESNTNEQENILQPKFKILKQHSMHQPRKPLANLSIADFKGYIIQNDCVETLNEPLIPSTFKNDSNSAHKFHFGLPSFISPMKSNTKFLFRSDLNSIPDGLENEFNADDELELILLSKSVAIQSSKSHRRSLSLGKNDLKRNLIKKNGFTILSN